MLAAALTAFDLLDHPEFVSLARHWMADREAPFVLQDWFLDRGLEGQARGVAFALRTDGLNTPATPAYIELSAYGKKWWVWIAIKAGTVPWRQDVNGYYVAPDITANLRHYTEWSRQNIRYHDALCGGRDRAFRLAICDYLDAFAAINQDNNHV